MGAGKVCTRDHPDNQTTVKQAYCTTPPPHTHTLQDKKNSPSEFAMTYNSFKFKIEQCTRAIEDAHEQLNNVKDA